MAFSSCLWQYCVDQKQQLQLNLQKDTEVFCSRKDIEVLDQRGLMFKVGSHIPTLSEEIYFQVSLGELDTKIMGIILLPPCPNLW